MAFQHESCLAAYVIGTATHLLASHALLESARPSPNQAVSLQRLVILHMFGELAERVRASRTLCATEKRHQERPDQKRNRRIGESKGVWVNVRVRLSATRLLISNEAGVAELGGAKEAEVAHMWLKRGGSLQAWQALAYNKPNADESGDYLQMFSLHTAN